MYRRKIGFPEENELVFGEVTNIQHNSVFVELDTYGRSGLIHISEISSGRIRNIRDYVNEGDRIICQVIQVDEDKGHIDLSLRRVTKLQKKNKRDQRKQEQKAEKLLRDLGDEINEYPKKAYQDIKQVTDHEYLHEAFNDVVEHDKHLSDLGFPERYAEPLERIVREKITRDTVKVGGELSLETYASYGISIIKDALTEAESLDDTLTIRYLGDGRYKIVLEDYNYDDAENTLEDALETIKDPIKTSPGGIYEFERKKFQ